MAPRPQSTVVAALLAAALAPALAGAQVAADAGSRLGEAAGLGPDEAQRQGLLPGESAGSALPEVPGQEGLGRGRSASGRGRNEGGKGQSDPAAPYRKDADHGPAAPGGPGRPD